jgi:hypothetical protein
MTLPARRVPLPEAPEFLDPEPEVEPVPMDGGGGTTFDAPADAEPEYCLEEDPLPPEDALVPDTEGGGGITLEPCDCPEEDRPEEDCPEEPLRFVLEAPTEGGGGMTLAVSDVPDPPGLRDDPEALEDETFGGGGTTSCVPKSLPMMLLTSDPLADWVGGGGTTLGAAERAEPLSRRRRSREESAEGGGATTAGAGMLSLAVREDSRSGAETGGGTTVWLFICTRDGEVSRVTADGAGAIMVP